MDILINPKGFVNMDYPGQGIGDIAGAGFREIVLDMALGCRNRQVMANPSLLPGHMAPLLLRCGEAGLGHGAGAVPRLPLEMEGFDIPGLQQKLAQESMEVCRKAGCRFLIAGPLMAGPLYGDAWKSWEANRGFYLPLAAQAKGTGVKILLENQCRDIGGHLVRGACSDSRQAAEWVDRLNEEAGGPLSGFCLDAGTCSLCGQNMYDFVTALGDRLKAVILRDNDGHKDSRLLPFTCASNGQSQTDWLSLIRGLRTIGFDGSLILDLADTASAFSPILRPGLLGLARSVAGYMGWQIEMEGMLGKYSSRVLFGAGNMCRNYMKCYGAKYPPLFTCDNREALWGTTFCGLEVRSPKALKDLPPDCAVFICNIYYREIEKQLRDMGIMNRIEYFNDEYMPTFYFDRLEPV